jgi:hypothetical protein
VHEEAEDLDLAADCAAEKQGEGRGAGEGGAKEIECAV